MAPKPTYQLLYHPGIPGRGEFIRLLLESSSTPYTDVSNTERNGYATVQKLCMSKNTESIDGNPPTFSPPALQVLGEGQEGRSLVISQTPNILAYLGEKTGMDGGSEKKWWVAQVALTALDLNNEVHDTHHPIAVEQYYEDQKAESLKKAANTRANRLPKFFSYFERTLQGNKERGGGKGKYLVGDRLTYADTTVWQCLEGCLFAFPKYMEKEKKKYPGLFGEFHEGIKGELSGYLESKRRLPFSNGTFRYYPELDEQ